MFWGTGPIYSTAKDSKSLMSNANSSSRCQINKGRYSQPWMDVVEGSCLPKASYYSNKPNLSVHICIENAYKTKGIKLQCYG